MRIGLAGRIAHAFLDSKLTPLLIAASLGLGALALLTTPREEEPQIRVPMVDVAVAWPGAEPGEIETRIVEPLERSMWGLSGVEHVYAAARSGLALVTVRFRPVMTLRSIRITSCSPNRRTSFSNPRTRESRPPAVAFANSTNW